MAKYIITYGHARLTDCENKVLKIVDSKKELYKFLKNYLSTIKQLAELRSPDDVDKQDEFLKHITGN